MKTMAELDKEEEARIARSHQEKMKKMGHGLRAWVEQLAREKRGGA